MEQKATTEEEKEVVGMVTEFGSGKVIKFGSGNHGPKKRDSSEWINRSSAPTHTCKKPPKSDDITITLLFGIQRFSDGRMGKNSSKSQGATMIVENDKLRSNMEITETNCLEKILKAKKKVLGWVSKASKHG